MTGTAAARTPVGPEGEDPRGDLAHGSIPGLVVAAAARFGDAEALADGDVRLSFADLESQALVVTRAAMAAGISPGDRAAIWAPNIAEWVVAALGLLGAGAVLVPINTRFKGPEAAYVLQRSGAVALFSVRGFLGFDYPAMLEGEDLPALDRIVLLRDLDESGPRSEPTVADEVPVFAWAEFLAGADGVVEGQGAMVGRPVTDADARARWAEIGPDDVSDIIFTSGTTGKPKGAVATHAQTLRTFAAWASIVGLSDQDRYLIVNPFFHTFGYKAGILACLLQGSTIVPEAVFDVDRVLETIGRERITMLPGPPTLYQSILDHPRRAEHDLSSLRLAVTGAAVVPVELIRRMRSELTFKTVLTAYGLTESTGVVTMCRQGDAPEVIAETSGRAIPGIEVAIVGDKPGAPALTPGEPGEIVVRGYTVMRGYFEDPEATAEAIDDEGWLHTGDIGVMDEAGNVRITDRKKDMFIVGGFNAYPAEIEGMLLRHPGVGQVAVVGAPDERLGEVGIAFVVPRPGVDPGTLGDDLVAWARGTMANYKVPRQVVVVEALPLNASGKVLKTELRARLAGS
ncbi:MAG TPA: FadD3 family acyl-CoA ligase [Acidimicrobiales bacterium]|nr:FadD3 family acyl-CoA ligase [Acidimicrobiales bacterium]